MDLATEVRRRAESAPEHERLKAAAAAKDQRYGAHQPNNGLICKRAAVVEPIADRQLSRFNVAADWLAIHQGTSNGLKTPHPAQKPHSQENSAIYDLIMRPAPEPSGRATPRPRLRQGDRT